MLLGQIDSFRIADGEQSRGPGVAFDGGGSDDGGQNRGCGNRTPCLWRDDVMRGSTINLLRRSIESAGGKAAIGEFERSQGLFGSRVFDRDLPRAAGEKFAADFDEELLLTSVVEDFGDAIGGIALQKRAEIDLKLRMSLSQRARFGIDDQLLPTGAGEDVGDLLVGRRDGLLTGWPKAPGIDERGDSDVVAAAGQSAELVRLRDEPDQLGGILDGERRFTGVELRR